MKLRNVLLFSAAVALLSQAVPAFAQGRARDARGRFVATERAICVLSPVGDSNVGGTIIFEQAGDHIRLVGRITGLTPGKHGFHVHQYGDLSSVKDGESAGGHFNPHNMKHGAPEAHTRHTGDLGNVTANNNGVAMIETTDTMIQLGGEDSIIGRSIIVHAKPDNFGQPTGNAGGRVAFGVIGWANPKSK